MKSILVFVLIAAVFADAVPREIVQFNDTNITLFLEGFLQGLGEGKSVDDLKKCIKNAEKIVDDIIEAFKLIRELTIPKIVAGIEKLLAALKEFSEMVKPCTTGYVVLIKLIRAIYLIDFKQLVKKFMSGITYYIMYITQIINAIQKRRYKDIGYNVGQLLKKLFLDPALLEVGNEKSVKFVMGFLKAIGDEPDTKTIEKCAKDIDDLIPKLKEAFEEIKKGHLRDILNGVVILIDSAKKFVKDLEACSKGLKVLPKLINAIRIARKRDIAMKIVRNLKHLVIIGEEMFVAFVKKDYALAGTKFGEMLKIIFL